MEVLRNIKLIFVDKTERNITLGSAGLMLEDMNEGHVCILYIRSTGWFCMLHDEGQSCASVSRLTKCQISKILLIFRLPSTVLYTTQLFTWSVC